MNIHEYQARPCWPSTAWPSQGKVADTPAEAESIAKEFGAPVVVKAQIHAGGRGKAAASSSPRTPTRPASTRSRSSDEPRDPPDGAAGQEGQEGPRRAGREDQEGVVPRDGHRPRRVAGRHDGVHRGRDGDRDGRRPHPEKILKEHVDPTVGSCRSRRASSPSGSRSRPSSPARPSSS